MNKLTFSAILVNKKIAERISQLQSVKALDTSEEPQGWTVIDAFSDIESSIHTLLTKLFPKFKDETLSADELQDVLWEVCEELRHIHYHITDVDFFRPYLTEGRERQKP